MTTEFWLTGNPEADALLATDDNALLLGMVLDQQVPMEKAFTGPSVIAGRMGGTLDVAAIAAMDEEAFVALCSQRPAIHRFPGAMGKRVRQVCQALVADFDGQAANVYRSATTGAELKAALMRLPGFGPEKATIFVAVLGKMRGVTPDGWRDGRPVRRTRQLQLGRRHRRHPVSATGTRDQALGEGGQEGGRRPFGRVTLLDGHRG